MSESAKDPPGTGKDRVSGMGVSAERPSFDDGSRRNDPALEGTNSGGEPTSIPPMPAEPSGIRRLDPRLGQVFGKYRVDAIIGKGGMGTVYEGEDVVLNRRVAIKFLPESLTENPKAIERFITEAQVAGRLNHPNIIAIYDIGQEADHYFMVMELLNPLSTATYLKDRGALHWTEATKIAADCAAALHAAHQVGLVHRDIKPDNILCSPTGATKLVDFGLVKDLQFSVTGLTQTGVVAGTPLYMSPEQASDSGVDHRSDIYSLGATYFALLTGRPPYTGEAAPQIMFKHCTAPTPDPRELVPEIPASCVQVLMKSMAKSPDDRYQTADDFRLALEMTMAEASRRVQSFLVPQDPSLFSMRARPLGRMPSLGTSSLNPKTATPGSLPSTRSSLGYLSGGQAGVSGNTPSPTGGRSSGETPSAHSNTPRSGQSVGVPRRPTSKLAVVQSRLSLAIGAVGLAAALIALALVIVKNVFSGPKVPPVQPPVQPPQLTQLPSVPIRVGVLNSLQGTMAISARPIVDATLLAIEEINATGGLLGRKVEPMLVDGHSENAIFAREAERLIAQERVVTIFGGWTPSNRKAMKPVIEKYDHLLIFPSRDEGMEDSPNIIYNGATPNQQVLPAARYAIEKLGKRRIYMVGSDGLLGHMSNELIKDSLQDSQAKVVGEKFVLLSETNFKPIFKKMREVKPDVIFNIVNGDSNLAFFRDLRASGVMPSELPTVSFSIGENELSQFAGIDMVGDYLAWNYFESVDRPQNREFVERFKKKYGSHRGISDPMEAAYFGVYLWAQAVRQAGTDDTKAIRRALQNQKYDAPGALVRIDPANNHTWKVFHVGRIGVGNKIEIVYSSDQLIQPEPFPSTRTRAQWEALIEHLYQLWDGNWVNPARPNLLRPPTKAGK